MVKHQFSTPPNLTGYRKGCRCTECREIRRIYTRSYRLKNSEKIRVFERINQQRRTATGQLKSYQQAYRAKYPEKARGYARRWRINNPEKWKESQRNHAKTEKYRTTRAQPAKRARAKKWKEAYRQTERGKKVIQNGWLAHHAHKLRAAGTCTTDQLQARWAMFGDLCYLCGAPATTTDHVIPLSKGGANWSSNLRPCCKSCNSRKNNMPLQEFLERYKTMGKPQ